ncbi:MAG: hypothetical protein AAGC55_29335 [Myxococcota bacterium]
MATGGPVWNVPVPDTEQRDVLLGLLSCGVRAVGLHMAVGRDRWQGAPIDELGQDEPAASWLGPLHRALAEVDWTALRRQPVIALIASRAEARAAVASSAVEPLSPVVAEVLRLGTLGVADLALDASAASHRAWFEATCDALDLAQVPYDIVDEDCADEVLAGYRAVVMPTVRRVDRAVWSRLGRLAAAGTVVVVGPERPTHDELDRPLDEPVPRGAGLIRGESLRDIDGFADDLAQLVDTRPDRQPGLWVSDHSAIDCALFVDPREGPREGPHDGPHEGPHDGLRGRPRVLFVSNRSEEHERATIAVAAGISARDALTGEPVAVRLISPPDRDDDDGDDGVAELELELAPLQVRMLIVD